MEKIQNIFSANLAVLERSCISQPLHLRLDLKCDILPLSIRTNIL